jgi:hypothetical protein
MRAPVGQSLRRDTGYPCTCPRDAVMAFKPGRIGLARALALSVSARSGPVRLVVGDPHSRAATITA